MKVLKFGGSSVGTPDRIRGIVDILKSYAERGDHFTVVFSAFGGVTDALINMSSLAAKGFKIYDAARARQHLEPARTVVDLHIEKLADNWKQMSNYEILSLQLRTFEKYYDLAIAHRQPTLIVIHGVGEGVLRNEIHDILRLKREVKSFINQYHPSFGYGATEIYFQYE